jgi:23S rRNA-/tRNA-specific pseudouridylate synthase
MLSRDAASILRVGAIGNIFCKGNTMKKRAKISQTTRNLSALNDDYARKNEIRKITLTKRQPTTAKQPRTGRQHQSRVHVLRLPAKQQRSVHA